MKKLTALLATGAMTSALCVTALAGNITTTLESDGCSISGGNFVFDFNEAGLDPTTFTTITFTVTCDDMEAGAGGGIMMNSTSTDWLQDDNHWSWAQEELADKESNFVATPTGNDKEYTITYTPGVQFTADDKADAEGYAQVVLQQWWGSDIVVVGVETDATGAEAAGDVAPVAFLAAIVAVAGLALVASKKARA